jgi:UrcA family protein
MKTAIKSQPISTASILAAIFLVLSATAAGSKAFAAETLRYNTAIVAFGDLNLDSQQGLKVLYARLRSGAEEVCSSFEGRDLFFKKVWQTCFDKAVASAVAQVNRAGLTTLHNQTVDRFNAHVRKDQ